MIVLAERQTMKSVRVSDIESARFFQGDRDTMKPSFVITGLGDAVARAKVVGTVTEKFRSDDGRFASITIDDGTGAIRARVFSSEIAMIEGVSVGDLVSVVGRMKNYNDENYLSPDFVRKLDDPNSETLFRLEVLKNSRSKRSMVEDLRRVRDQMSDEELSEYASGKYGLAPESLSSIMQAPGSAVDHKPTVLAAISKLDKGEGAEIGKILEETKLDESMAESAINDLLSSGEIYEPVAGRLRRV